MKNTLIAFTTILFSFNILYGQSITQLKTHVDGLVEKYSSEPVPGIGGAIIKDGKVLYSYAAGIADIETGTKINLQTKFNVDDLAKQFTAMALLTLVDKGIVSLEDNVQKYIPEFSKYEYELKVKHLLNHTSGLDDYLLTHILAGGLSSHSLSKENALSLILLQEKLAFIPGTDFSIYNSDTEILLISIIIANASDQNFEGYTRNNVFIPLGMKNTLFIENNNSIIENVAKSYEEIDGVYCKNKIYQGISGPSNLYTSIEDMAIWYSYFSPSQNSILAKSVQRLDQSALTDTGISDISFWGEMKIGQYFRHAERGLPKDWQFGLIGGYGANVFKFQEEDITSFAIGNNNSYNGSTAMDAISPLMENKYKGPASTDPSLIDAMPISSKDLNAWKGEYFNEKGGMTRAFDVVNDTLIYKRPNSDTKLLHVGDNVFQAIVGSDDIILFSFMGTGNNRSYTYSSSGSDPILYRIFERVSYSDVELENYVGVYYNVSLSSIYQVTALDGKLIVKSFNQEDVVFTPVLKGFFASNSLHMSKIIFDNSDKMGAKFTVQTYGVNAVEFIKL